MGYRLGVDLGTTFTSAAVLVDGTSWPAMVGLGNRAMQIPSVLFLKPDGEFLVGEAAERRGAVEPDRVAREFKRRLGDRVPILVGGTPFSAQALQARLLTWVVEQATRLQGAPPDRITVTCPANWGPFKRDLFSQALTLAGIRGADVITEPEAVAVLYAARNTLATGDTIAVYDLGGGTFDTAILRKTDVGFEILGTPEGIEQLGGIDFDEAVFHHTISTLTAQVASELTAQLTETAGDAGLARLRRDCVDAKEALSADTETTIAVALPGLTTSVRLVRADFEDMIAPTITDTTSALRRALESAGIAAADLTAIVMSGGSSRIPLVARRLEEDFGRPLALDSHPKHDVALGATLVDTVPSAGTVTATAAVDPEQPTEPLPVAGSGDTRDELATVVTPPPAPPLAPTTPLPDDSSPPGTTSSRRPLLILAAAALVVTVGVVVALVVRSGSDDDPTDVADTTPTTETSETSEPTEPTEPTEPPAETIDDDTLLVTGRAADAPDELTMYAVDVPTGEATVVDLPDPGGAKQARQPTISPDRTSFAYLVGVSGNTPGELMIATVGETPRPLLDDDSPCSVSTRPAFSPDGDQLALVCPDDDGVYGLFIVDLEGALVRQLEVPTVPLRAATWTDDDRLVFQADPEDSRHGLWSVDAFGEGEPRLITGQAGFEDSHPDWLEGRGLLFARSPEGEVPGDIWLLDENGERPITDEGTFDSPAWSPDGSMIAYIDTSTGTPTLWTLDFRTGERTAVPGVPGQVGAPAWGTR